MGQFSEGNVLGFSGEFLGWLFLTGEMCRKIGCPDPHTGFPLSVAVMIWATLVNTQTDRQLSTGYIL